MAPQLLVRTALKKDISFILECEANPLNTYVHGWDQSTHEANLIDPAYSYVIAESNGERLAFAILRCEPNNRAEWRRVIVAKPNTGIGKAFMQAVIKQKFQTGTQSIWLDVYEDNRRARHVYSSLGFVETHRKPPNETSDQTLVFMELTKSE